MSEEFVEPRSFGESAMLCDMANCKACGWPIVLASCNDQMADLHPTNDWWVYCSNQGCAHHAGDGFGQQEEPAFMVRRTEGDEEDGLISPEELAALVGKELTTVEDPATILQVEVLDEIVVGYGLVMPFLDGSETYVFGFEAGKMFSLMHDCGKSPTFLFEGPVHTKNLEQLRMMSDVFDVALTIVAEEDEDWTTIRLQPKAKPRPQLRLVGAAED